MIDTLMLEKKYYELMGEADVTIVEDECAQWLEAGPARKYYLPTICWSTEQAAKVMLLHKINVMFREIVVDAWHYEGIRVTTVYYHRDESTRAYFSADEVFNVAVLQAAVDLLERKGK